MWRNTFSFSQVWRHFPCLIMQLLPYPMKIDLYPLPILSWHNSYLRNCLLAIVAGMSGWHCMRTCIKWLCLVFVWLVRSWVDDVFTHLTCLFCFETCVKTYSYIHFKDVPAFNVQYSFLNIYRIPKTDDTNADVS